jgi:hypothetical protein
VPGLRQNHWQEPAGICAKSGKAALCSLSTRAGDINSNPPNSATMKTCRLIILLVALPILPASAATKTWDGGGATNNWNVPANWNSDTLPNAGDDLVFPAGIAAITGSASPAMA